MGAGDLGRLDPSSPPDSVTFRIPAHLGFLGAIRAAVSVVVQHIECDDACDADMQLATDELGAVLINDALPWSEIELAIAHDDTDVYVRMSAQRAAPGQNLVVAELSQMLLAAAVESYDVRAEDACTFAVLQRPCKWST